MENCDRLVTNGLKLDFCANSATAVKTKRLREMSQRDQELTPQMTLKSRFKANPRNG